MVFYNYFHSTGRRVLIDALACPDPFGISPREIVERILAAGYKPHVESPKTEPHHRTERVVAVQHRDQIFLVGISRDAEEISVQEVRVDAYPT